MLTQPPSDRTRAPGMHPSPEFWILSSGFFPKNAKQTQFTPGDSPDMRNKPNLRRGPQIYELPTTNYELFMRNKPNFRIPSVPTHPKNTKRTQFQDVSCPLRRLRAEFLRNYLFSTELYCYCAVQLYAVKYVIDF